MYKIFDKDNNILLTEDSILNCIEENCGYDVREYVEKLLNKLNSLEDELADRRHDSEEW